MNDPTTAFNAITRREPWQDRALCAQTDPEIFYPEPGGTPHAAKRVCRACPVRQDCLQYALDHRERFGIWGGTVNTERERLGYRSINRYAPKRKDGAA